MADLWTNFTGNEINKIRPKRKVSCVELLHYIPGRWMRESSPQEKPLQGSSHEKSL